MRGAGEGSFGRDADGRYVWKLRFKGRTVVRKAKSRKELNTLVAEAREQVRATRLPLKLSATMTVAEYLAAWVADYGPSLGLRTAASYAQVVRLYVSPVIGDVAVGKLAAVDCQRLLTGMIRRGLSPTTANYVRTVMRKAFDGATTGRPPLMAANPWRETRRFRPGEVEVNVLSERDEAALRAECGRWGEDGLPVRSYGPLVIFILETGLRISEANGLKPGDVADGALTVRRKITWVNRDDEGAPVDPHPVEEATKSRTSRRTIPLTETARAALADARALNERNRLAAGDGWHGDPYLFLRETGRAFDPSNVYRSLGLYLRKAGCEKASIHDLRKTFGTRVARGGAPPHVLQRLMGHASITTTMRFYVGAYDDDLSRALGIEGP